MTLYRSVHHRRDLVLQVLVLFADFMENPEEFDVEVFGLAEFALNEILAGRKRVVGLREAVDAGRERVDIELRVDELSLSRSDHVVAVFHFAALAFDFALECLDIF